MSSYLVRPATARDVRAVRELARRVRREMRPTAEGMPGRPIMSDETTKRATSMAMPRSLASPEAARGETARSETAAQPR
jgi:hypothetical protein